MHQGLYYLGCPVVPFRPFYGLGFLLELAKSQKRYPYWNRFAGPLSYCLVSVTMSSRRAVVRCINYGVANNMQRGPYGATVEAFCSGHENVATWMQDGLSWLSIFLWFLVGGPSCSVIMFNVRIPYYQYSCCIVYWLFV